MISIPCACCSLSAFKVIGDCIQVTVRHNGAYHTSVVSLTEIQDKINKAAMQSLLDSRERVIVT